jgi:PmbA protein
MSRDAIGEIRAQDLLSRAIDIARGAGADLADALLVESSALEARVRDASVDFVTQAREHTLGIRALVAGDGGFRSAITSTSDLSIAAIERMAREAVALGRATAVDPAAGIPEDGFASDAPDLQLCDANDRDREVDQALDDAFAAERAARATDPRISNSEGSQADAAFTRVSFANSRGFFGSYEMGSHSLFSEPLAIENGSKQRDYWLTVARRRSELDPPESVGRRAALRALRRLGAKSVPTCEAPVIFDPVAAASLVGHIAACVNGYAVYRETSYLADRLGEQIASELVTVVDDGRRPGGLGSKPFDGEGLPTRRNLVLDRGRLETFLLDSYSARKLGKTSTGNAARSAGSPPTAAPTNLWLEPGEPSLDEIIADTDRGLLVTELIGMGFNPVTGDYSRGAAGLWIEKGKIQHPVEEITIAGNFGDMLKAVDLIGSELLWLGSVAAPPLRIASMTIAGE